MVELYGNMNLEKGTDSQPLLTFALFAYNQESFIREAVQGAFSQIYSPMEIILSDDCSSDRTFEILKEMAHDYVGPHLIKLRRSARNNGFMLHINSVHQVSSGEILLMAAGDDISLAHRATNIARAFSDRKVMATCSAFKNLGTNAIVRQTELECADVLRPLSHVMNLGGVGHGASYAYRRCVFSFSGYPGKSVLSEDRLLPIRAALLGHVLYLKSADVIYRTYDDQKIASTKELVVTSLSDEGHLREVRNSISFARQGALISAPGKVLLLAALHVSARIRNAGKRPPGLLNGINIMFWRVLIIPFRALHQIQRKLKFAL